jgi:dCTP deaminase
LRQVQPNSLDLQLGGTHVRLPWSFLPGPEGVRARFAYSWNGIGHGLVLRPGQVYLFPLAIDLKLPPGIHGVCNPKSTTGRLDVFARVVTETGEAFDTIPAGYEGELFVQVISRSFPVLVRPGDCLVQMRLVKGKPWHPAVDAAEWVLSSGPVNPSDGFHFSADLAPKPGRAPVAYRARKGTPTLDLQAIGAHAVRDFWEPVRPSDEGTLCLEPDLFYILASRERVRIPAGVCAEMVAFDATAGELRAHYAGFFDSGFGAGEGARVVLEVRTRDVPFLLRDGQPTFRFHLHRNLAVPDTLYGAGSSYQGQGLRLAKQFAQDSA